MSRFDLYVALALAAVAFALTVAVTWPGRSRVDGDGVTASRPQLPAPLATQPPSIAPVPVPPRPTPTLAGAQSVPPPKAPAPSVEPAPQEKASKLPALPVRVAVPFYARMGVRVIQIVATGSADEPLVIDVEISNEATGKRDQHTISLNPPKMVTLGQAEGVDIQLRDSVKVHAEGYADVVHQVL